MSVLLSPFFHHLPSLSVLNDAHLLGGPLLQRHAPWGVAVIAGTGSVVVGLEVEEGGVKGIGRRGGVGYLLGDDGSGKSHFVQPDHMGVADQSAFDLGRTAIRFAVDAFDEELEITDGLAKDMREHFEVETTPEILGKAVRPPSYPRRRKLTRIARPRPKPKPL